eukprot:1158493-Pelagomonas_calceolata.AAC.4
MIIVEHAGMCKATASHAGAAQLPCCNYIAAGSLYMQLGAEWLHLCTVTCGRISDIIARAPLAPKGTPHCSKRRIKASLALYLRLRSHLTTQEAYQGIACTPLAAKGTVAQKRLEAWTPSSIHLRPKAPCTCAPRHTSICSRGVSRHLLD